MSKIEIKVVSTKRLLKSYIRLPFKLHQNHPNWVPPLLYDEKRYYNPKYNSAFSYCETVMALAFRGNVPLGRIMGIINNRYNDLYNTREARFSYLESTGDDEVTASLLSFIEKWAKDKEMEKLIGPYGMTYLEPEGFLVDGFEYPPTISSNYNYPYIIDHLKTAGYQPENDYVIYKIDLPNKIPDIYYRIRQRIYRNNIFKLVEFSTKKEIRQNSVAILELMNDCFTNIFGYSLLDKKEMINVAKQYLNFLEPDFIKVVKKDKEMVGFIIAMPHISKGLQKSKGNLFPVGFFHILRDLKHSTQIDLLLGGVKQKYQGTGIDVLLGMSMIETAVKKGFKLLDSHNELESNLKIRAEMERMGGKIYKRYRVFEKMLSD